MAVIISANRDFHAQFEAAGIKFGDGGSTIMTCNACKVLGGDALKESKEKYPEVIEFNYSSSKKAPAIEVKKMLTCGAMTIVTIIFMYIFNFLVNLQPYTDTNRFNYFKVSNGANYRLMHKYLLLEQSSTTAALSFEKSQLPTSFVAITVALCFELLQLPSLSSNHGCPLF